MRTVLTLDPDIAQLVEDAVHRARKPMKQVINDALRRALSQPPARREPYRLPVHEAALRPAWTWPALTAWQTSWKTRRFSLPGASRVVIIPDVNLLLYGVVSAFPQHKPAHAWWEGTINSAAEIGLPSPAIFGFVRIATSPRVLAPPIAVEAAMGYVSAWLGQPNVSRLVPGRRHIEIASGLLHGVGTGGNLTTDVQLAALALESDADMYSNDTDFARFPGLRWVNLLA